MKHITAIILIVLAAGFLILQMARNQEDEIARRRTNAIAHSIEERPIYYGGR